MNDADATRHWVGHADIDAFYASVEQRDCPAYRDRPVVVGALPGHRGVVAAASYQAREFGIHSAMPIAEAYRRCPDAVYVRPDMEKYRRVSREIFEILGTISPVVEPVSVDEAYLDLGGLARLVGSPEEIGQAIRRRVAAGTGLTASVGIGPNRLIAKLGSEHRKPDGLTVVAPDQVAGFLAPMPISKLRGLGRETHKLFSRLGIQTIQQLRAIPLHYLEQHLGRHIARKFHDQANGIASAEVRTEQQRKSISKETTFQHNLTDHAALRDVLRDLAAEVAATARREGLCGSVVTLKVRFEGFETHTRQHRLERPTHDERVLLREAWSLFVHSQLPAKPLRLIGVGISAWDTNESQQTDIFAPERSFERDERLLETLDKAVDRFGKGALTLGRVPKTPERK